MMMHEDWLMRQIQQTIYMLAKVFFKKDMVQYTVVDELHQTTTDMLHNRLMDMVDKMELNEAENLLFSQLDPGDSQLLLLALTFYQRVGQMPDDVLEAAGFPREEVYQGLMDLGRVYGVSLGYECGDMPS